MNEMTLEHSKTRVQFSNPIGSYQVVQHRLADMFMAQEQGRCMVIERLFGDPAYYLNKLAAEVK
ncbi:MAG: acyl-CoA dehydrogenase family protein [Rhodopila sp.]|nr:acyl-CoA dehydrogenase family protein [Rhodopila sp.]